MQIRTPDAETPKERRRAIWRSPRSLTAFIPVDDESATELESRLVPLQERFHERLALVDDLHSFRLCALPADTHSGRSVSMLINCVHDHSPAEHVQSLIEHAGDLFAVALGIDGECLETEKLVTLILNHRVREDTIHLGSIGRSLAQIREELALRQTAQQFVAHEIEHGRWDDSTEPERIRRDVRNHFLTVPTELPRRRACEPTRRARKLKFIDLLKTFILFPFIGVLYVDIQIAIRRISPGWRRRLTWLAYMVWWLYGFIFTAAGFLLSRIFELTESDSVADPPDESLVRRLEDVENSSHRNLVTILFDVRDSYCRRWYLSMILRGAELGCRHFWTDGRLTGIATIHYARIVQVDGNRRLLFMSDYDGGLNRYLDDFLGFGSRAVIPFTSNLVDCPKTRWLYQIENADDFAPRWKGMIRRYQLFTAVRYHAYPDMTVQEILDNAAFRNELFAEGLSPEAAARWARRL